MNGSSIFWLLFLFGVILLMGALFLMWGKSRSGRTPRDFHDSR